MQTRSQVKLQRSAEPDFGKNITADDLQRIQREACNAVARSDPNNTLQDNSDPESNKYFCCHNLFHEFYDDFAEFVQINAGKRVFSVHLVDENMRRHLTMWFTDPKQAVAYRQMLFNLPSNIVTDMRKLGYFQSSNAAAAEDDGDDDDGNYYMLKPCRGSKTGVKTVPISKEEYEENRFQGLDIFDPNIRHHVYSRIVPEHHLLDKLGGEDAVKVVYSVICDDGIQRQVDNEIIETFVQNNSA